MDITDVRIRKINNAGRLKANASITFGNEFVIHDIKIIDGSRGLFIAMPNRKTPDGEYKDIVHPINQNVRDIMQDAVLSKYEVLESVQELTLNDNKTST